jgi:hypothetical protein
LPSRFCRFRRKSVAVRVRVVCTRVRMRGYRTGLSRE